MSQGYDTAPPTLRGTLGNSERQRGRGGNWRKDGAQPSLKSQIYRKQCSASNRVLKQAKQDFYSQTIEECGRDQKRLANITNELRGEKEPAELPKSDSNKALPDRFSALFWKKIQNIRDATCA